MKPALVSLGTRWVSRGTNEGPRRHGDTHREHPGSFIYRLMTTCFKDYKTCWCRGQREHSVLTEDSFLCFGHVTHILEAPEERCTLPPPPTPPLITSHVFFRKMPGPLVPSTAGLHKSPSFKSPSPIGKLFRWRQWTGSMFPQTKTLMTYFTVGLAFCPDTFCLPLGVPPKWWDDCRSLPY